MAPDAPPSASVLKAAFWPPFLVAFIAWGLSNMDQSLFGYAVPALMQQFGLGLDKVSLLISGSFAFGILVSVAVGVLTDLWGAKRTLPLCLGVSALFVGLQAYAPDAAAFSVFRILGFGFSAALFPITTAMVADAAPARFRGLALAGLSCAYPLGWFAASLFVAPVSEAYGWRAAFLAGFAVVPLAALMYLFIPKRPRAPKAVAAKRVKSPLSALFSPQYLRTSLCCMGAFFLYGGAVGGTTFYLPTFFTAVRGYDAATAASIVGLSYGIGVIGYIGSALVSDHLLSPRATSVLWLVLGAAGLAVTLWLPHTPAQDIAAFGVTCIFFYGSASIMAILLMDVFPAPIRATAAATCGTACISAGFIVFPILVAQAVALIGWQMSLSLLVVPAAAIAGLLLLALKHRPRGAAEVVDADDLAASEAGLQGVV